VQSILRGRAVVKEAGIDGGMKAASNKRRNSHLCFRQSVKSGVDAFNIRRIGRRNASIVRRRISFDKKGAERRTTTRTRFMAALA
jgi:hypothetical protein